MAYLGNAPVVGDSTNSFRLLDDIASFTLTFDATDTAVVSIANDTLSFRNHRFVTGQKVTYTDGGGTAIGGLTDGTSYFIIKVDQNTIKLATNASNAASSTAINLTSGAAGGSHTLNVKFDGVNTKFKATFNNGKKAKISRAAQLSLSINGVVQQPQDSSSPSVGYGVEADSTIVFSTAPVATDVVFGSFIGEVAASFDLEDNTVDNFTGDGSTTIFNLSKEVPSSQDVLVTIDGVTQYPSDGSTTRSYSVVDQALTFVSAPADGTAIQARHIGFAGATTSAVTGLYGRTGNVALISTDDISVQNVSGVGATFTGNVNIEGVLTYEDVTNVDSIGIITARAGVLVGSGITLSKDGDVFFTGIATGNGSGLTALNASNISSGTVPTARLGSGTASSSTFLRGDSTFQTVNTDLVSDTSPQLGGDLDTNDHNILLDDDHQIKFGDDTDMNIRHTGSYGILENSTGALYLRSSSFVEMRGNNNETFLKGIEDGAVELYYDNSKKFETTTSGCSVTGSLTAGSLNLGSGDLTLTGNINISDSSGGGNNRLIFGIGDDLQIWHDGSDSYIADEGTGALKILSNLFRVNNAANNEAMIKAEENGAVTLSHNGSEKFETKSTGVEITGTLETTSGGINAGGNISLNDNVKLKCGTSDDLQIDHSGTNSQIYHDGTGHLYIGTQGSGEELYLFANDNVRIQTAGNEDAIKCNKDGAVYLYNDNALKFFTTADGIQVKNENLLRFKKETSTSGEVTAIQFEKDNPTNIVGRIRYDNGQTHYNTTSDYRLKENNVAITDGITRISQLKPYRFNFKVDPSKTVDGFFAHEVSSVVPEAISGEKDAVRDVLYNAQDIMDGTLPDGKSVGDVKESGVIDAQEIDQAKLVPLLVAAVQELIAEVEKLKSS